MCQNIKEAIENHFFNISHLNFNILRFHSPYWNISRSAPNSSGQDIGVN